MLSYLVNLNIIITNFLIVGLLKSILKCFKTKLIALLLFATFVGNAQDMQVNILGGAIVAQSSTISITAGNSITFRIINTRSNCGTLKVEDIILDNPNFSVSHKKLSYDVKSSSCKRGNKYLDFTVTNISGGCASSTDITIKNNKDNTDFIFTVSINSSPEIYVLGGSPWADINHGDGVDDTSPINGTSFGVVDEGNTVTRRYIVANIGSCDLNITSLSSSNLDFTVTVPSPYSIPFVGLPSYTYIVIDVAFTVDNLTPAGTNTAVISIGNTDNTTFTFTVSGEVFDYNIPGPGGITADFRLWLKANRGISVSSGSKLEYWGDVGTNLKNATQGDVDKQPTYYDDIDYNINFNPVVSFENDGSVEQYMNNTANGFYSQDIFIVMGPPVLPSTSYSSSTAKNTIFAGNSSGLAGDITGVGLGDYTTRFTGEVITYAQNTESSFNGFAQTGSDTYSVPGIINVRNETSPSLSQELYYNSNLIANNFINDATYANVSNNLTGDAYGSPYWLGKNADTPGSFNGRIAEVFTFASTVNAQELEIIESYLAIKYGITLDVNGTSEEYFNSDNVEIWDPTANSGFNWNIAGIARDDDADLNQKQSKSINDTREVTIGLGGIFDTNSANPNEFSLDKQALMWGCNNGDFTGTATTTYTATGLTTSLSRIDRKWKIVETGTNIGHTYIAIPTTAFSGFSKTSNEEYVLIVADNPNFDNGDIFDVIPLKINVDSDGDPILDKEGNSLYKTWYDFDGTKYFTFGKAAQLTGNRSISFATGDFLVGERALNLGVDAFTISAWIKSTPTASDRTIMSKGTKLQFILNSVNKIEIWSDDDSAPKFTSNMVINDSKWHQISMVYDSGTIFLYVDGVLDKSVQDIVHPSINYNNYSIGALYLSKDNITNPFLGEIDEVYVWDIGLTESQIRYLMNQEIEKITGDLVNGKTIPLAFTDNELVGIPWSKLKVYYSFNSLYGSTVEGLTDARTFLRLNYLAKGKSIVEPQTAPIPYVTAATGNWDDEATWVNGTDNILPNGLGVDGSTIDWNIVNVLHDITSGDRDIDVLGLIIPENVKFTIADPIVTTPIELNDGQGLTISHYLELDGVIDLVGESQLIQLEGSILDEDSGGYIERDQQGTANSYNYNYWSSSVGVISGNASTSGTGLANINAGASVSEVLLDGTDSSNPLAISFNGSHSSADASYTGAKRISTYWLYKFSGSSEDYNAWSSINENSTLLPGEGYTMKGTSGSEAITTNQNYVFKGKPNNGDITLPISVGQNRLIGNPYPSGIDADEFILDNIKSSETFTNAEEEKTGRNIVNVFNGALYFWHHFGEENSHALKDYVGGYATYTLMGGTEAYSTDDLINNTTSSLGGGKVPERYIPANQGFFVSAYLPSSLSGTTTTVEGGEIIFKNSQRVFERERMTGINEGSLFFKNNKKSTIVKAENSDNRSKIRLKFNSPKGYHRQLLVGVDANATNNFDLGYDAPVEGLGGEDMFWSFSGAKFIIQAVNNFNEDQELSLGLVVGESGFVVIKIDTLENVDETVELFIKDNTTLRFHKINDKPFEMNLEAGEYLDRFSLVFKSKKVEIEESSVEEYVEGIESTLIEGVHLYMNNTTYELQINRNEEVVISEIQVYNYLGQLISNWEKGFEAVEFSLPFNKATGVYFIQTKTNIGLINKKIIVEN